MENTNVNADNTGALTKKDITGAWKRWFIFSEVTHSYERMQSIAVTIAYGDCLKKLYKDDDEGFKRSLKRHMVFFNTEGVWGCSVLGMALALEESLMGHGEDEKDEVINDMKTSLMGPLAGLGDSIDWGTLKPIICGLGIALSANGSPIGVLFCLAFCLLLLFISNKCWWMGYKIGAQALTGLVTGPLFTKIVRSASMLGLFMMGVLTASYVSLTTTIQIPTGDSMLALQGVLDSIVPGILPFALVLGMYWILKNKTQKFGLIAISMVVISLICALIGIF